MKIIRLFLACLVVAFALVAVLVLAAIAPAAQTWFARMELNSRPGTKGSLESLSAGFGEVDVEGLHLETDGAVLTLPSLQAKLPLTIAILRRKAEIRGLVAKGWTLDLSRGPGPADAPVALAAAGAVSAQAARALLGTLSRLRLPFDGSLDGVDLEGDVRFAAPPGKTPAQVHITITGGGMAAGHEGTFAGEAVAVVPEATLATVDAHGSVAVAMDSPRTFSRLEMKAQFSDLSGSHQNDLTLSAAFAAARGAGEETYAIDLGRGGRHLATAQGRFPLAALRTTGTWSVDLRDSDLAPLAPGRPLPSISATGNGDFDADAAFAHVHMLGDVTTVAGRLGVLAPALEGLGAVSFGTRFDLVHAGRSLHVTRLSVSLGGARGAAAVESIQPFDLDERTGDVTVANPRGDWLGVSIRALPLASLSGLPKGISLTGRDAAGEFAVLAADGGFALRPKTPITASGVSIQGAGRTLGHNLDLSLSLAADYDSKGWRVRWAPLTVDSAGRRVASSEGGASRLGGADQPIAVSGTWTADLGALAAQAAIPMLAGSAAHSASGEFSVSLGASTDVDGKVAVTGRDPAHSISASVHADIDSDGGITFTVPLKIAMGPSMSDLSVEGSWSGENAGNWVDAKLTGGDVSLQQLRLLAAPLAAAGGAPMPPAAGLATGTSPAPGGARDVIPFWGNWGGHVTVALDRLRTGEGDLTYVGGTFDVDRGSIQLRSGRGGFGLHVLTGVEGSISFDSAAEFPYSLRATAPVIKEIDAAPLFAAQQHGQDPMLEGHFSVASSLAGKGVNLGDLVSRAQEEFRLTSTAGIVRLLGTSVADAIPEGSSPVSDTLGSVGYVVGSFFGLKGDSVSSGKNPISKNGEAVINFTYQVGEIGFDKMTVTAIRDSDGTIHLADIEMTAPDELLKGSGQITQVKGLPFFKEPLSVDVQLSIRGKAAELLATAGLLPPQKDSRAFAALDSYIHFGGTLEQIDASKWRELLVKAATRKPEGEKKAPEAPVHPTP